MSRNKGFIYIKSNKESFKDDPVYKIGKSVDPENRRSDLSTAMPYPFKIEHIWSVENMHEAERTLHNKLKKYRITGQGAGTEFFRGELDHFIKVGNELFCPDLEKNKIKWNDCPWDSFRAMAIYVARHTLLNEFIPYFEGNEKYKMPRRFARLDSVGYRDPKYFYKFDKKWSEPYNDARSLWYESKSGSFRGDNLNVLTPRPFDLFLTAADGMYRAQGPNRVPYLWEVWVFYTIAEIVNTFNNMLASMDESVDLARAHLTDKKCDCLNKNKPCKTMIVLRSTFTVSASTFGLLHSIKPLLLMGSIDLKTSKLYDWVEGARIHFEKQYPTTVTREERYQSGTTRPGFWDRVWSGRAPEPIYSTRKHYSTGLDKLIHRLDWVIAGMQDYVAHKRCPAPNCCWYEYRAKSAKKHDASRADVIESMELKLLPMLFKLRTILLGKREHNCIKFADLFVKTPVEPKINNEEYEQRLVKSFIAESK